MPSHFAIALNWVSQLPVHAPLQAPVGGLKVIAESGFAARPSGTENIYKIYAESFRGATI